MLTYNVFDDVFELRNLVDDFFRDIPSRSRGREYPYIRMHEGGDEIVIHALLPGMKAEEVSINLVDASLIIEGEKKSDYADQPYIRKERNFGRFKKSVKLPYQVDGGSVKAELKEGILAIAMKKSSESMPRKIEIH